MVLVHGRLKSILGDGSKSAKAVNSHAFQTHGAADSRSLQSIPKQRRRAAVVRDVFRESASRSEDTAREGRKPMRMVQSVERAARSAVDDRRRVEFVPSFSAPTRAAYGRRDRPVHRDGINGKLGDEENEVLTHQFRNERLSRTMGNIDNDDNVRREWAHRRHLLVNRDSSMENYNLSDEEDVKVRGRRECWRGSGDQYDISPERYYSSKHRYGGNSRSSGRNEARKVRWNYML